MKRKNDLERLCEMHDHLEQALEYLVRARRATNLPGESLKRVIDLTGREIGECIVLIKSTRMREDTHR